MSTAFLTACLLTFGCLGVLRIEAISPPNIALGKPAMQSSTYLAFDGTEYFDTWARYAVDGKPGTHLDTRSCSSTTDDDKAWWGVDLGDIYNLDSVQITRRDNGGLVNRLQDFKIEISLGRDISGNLVNPCLCVHQIEAQPLATTRTYNCAQRAVGRYVRIQLQTSVGYLTLCEVQMFGTQATNDNLALSRPAFQSSVLGTNIPALATDGVLSDSSCASTELNDHAFWMVDLGAEYQVVSVNVTGRGDTFLQGRVTNFTIETSNVIDNFNNLYNTCPCASGSNVQLHGSTKTYTCTNIASGRFLRIQLQGVEQLTLCEVEVFGFKTKCPPIKPPRPAIDLCCDRIHRDEFCPNFAYVSRFMWGAAEAKPSTSSYPLTLAGPTVEVVVRIVYLGAGYLTCRNIDDCSRHARLLQQKGFQQSDDIGENFVVSTEPRVYVGRGWDGNMFENDKIIVGILGTPRDICTDTGLMEMLAAFLECLLERYNRDFSGVFAIRGVSRPVRASAITYRLCSAP